MINNTRIIYLELARALTETLVKVVYFCYSFVGSLQKYMHVVTVTLISCAINLNIL